MRDGRYGQFVVKVGLTPQLSLAPVPSDFSGPLGPPGGGEAIPAGDGGSCEGGGDAGSGGGRVGPAAEAEGARLRLRRRRHSTAEA